MLRAFALLCAVTAWLTLSATSALAQGPSGVRYRDPVFERVERTLDITYGHAVDIPSGREVELKLDLYEPAGDSAARRATLIFVHGGGFVAGDKSSGRRWAMEFARRGWVVLSIGYRLNQGELMTVGVPAAVSDARQAVAWTHAQADAHRIDRTRVAIGGSSAGAITSLFVAYTDMEKAAPDDPSGVVAVMDLWGGLYGQEDEMTAGEPPLIIVHGTEDNVVPFRLAEALRDRAAAAGIPYDYRPLDGVGHGSRRTADISAWTAEFFYPLLWPAGAETATPAPSPSPTATVASSTTGTPDTTATSMPGTTATPSTTATPAPSATTSPTKTATAVRTPGATTVYLPLALRIGPLDSATSVPTDVVPTITPTAGPPPTGTPTARPPTDTAPQVERVVTLLVDDGGRSDPPLPRDDVGRLLDDVRDWYDEVSYGRTHMAFEIHGWFEIEMRAGSALDPRIYQRAVEDGVDFRAFDHVLVLFHGGSGFGSSNSNHSLVIDDGDERYPLAATVSQVTGLRDTSGRRGVIAHELGHALGLPHASHLSQLSGEVTTYGTTVDTMGDSSSRGHFNAYHKWQLGWLPDAAVAVVDGDGTYQLRPIEAADGRRMLIVPVSGATTVDAAATEPGAYVVETRRAIGYDRDLPFNTHDGALLYRLRELPIADDESGARLATLSLDASPETATDRSDDFALMPGRTWHDPANDIAITVLAADDDHTTVRVIRSAAPDGVADDNAPPEIDGLTAKPVDGADHQLRLSADTTDSDGDDVLVFWNLGVTGSQRGASNRRGATRYGPGTHASGAVVEHTFPDDEPRTVCAVVSDGRGGQATDCLSLFGAENRPPEIRRLHAEPRGPRTVLLRADVRDLEPTWVRWDLGDGQSLPFHRPTYTYAEAATYTAQLTVSDGEHSVTRTLEVDARQSDNQPPVADAGPDQTVAPGEVVRLDGSGSVDPDQYPIGLRYIWDAPAPIELSDRHARAPTFVAPDAAGDYTIELRVFDGELYGSDEVVVTVTP